MTRQDNSTIIAEAKEAMAFNIARVHWEITRRMKKGKTLVESRRTVLETARKKGESFYIRGRETDAPPETLLKECYPELTPKQVRIAVAYQKRKGKHAMKVLRDRLKLFKKAMDSTAHISDQSKREKAISRVYNALKTKRDPFVFLVSESIVSRPRTSSRSRRSPVRSAAKSGGDDGGGDGDSDQGEPPRPSHKGRIILPAPIQARLIPFSCKANSFPHSRIVHPCRWSVFGRWAA